ncbi:MAG TPA: serine/threonine-protein kinase [Candidatus Acidoferrum sp.]
MERSSRRDKVKQIVDRALELDAGQRAAYLDQVCERNPSLRSKIESLILAYDQADDDLSHSPVSGPLLADEQRSQTIGPYRLLKILGEGGMGQVWLADQTSPVRRQVALKLIRSGMLHSIALQRFQAERQSLAIMDHPGIAKVFDAGTASGGRPYFVMEYVEGRPITQYCDQNKLPLRDRLRLFIQVCQAVQHAHQKAIIHRDLKPANILVVEVDGKPRPRIIDFGIAKGAAPSEPDDTMFTQAGVLLGTPGYMSPEQIDPSIRDVDTRSDVYSLGVVLYELLTGSLPFNTQYLKKQPLEKLLHLLRDEDPPSPSTQVGSYSGDTTVNADVRGLEKAQLVTELRGDLDWITMKALERERDRRYGAPSELAADIERYLQNKPVNARPASAAYRLRKYIRRHRVAVGVASGALALLIAFAVMEAVQLRRISRERDRASRITEFMTSMFKVSEPSQSRGNTITAREILDKASADIDTGLAKDPELKAELTDVMGNVYTSLGLYPKGGALLQSAVETKERVLGPNSPKTLLSMSNLAWNLQRQGHYVEAEKLGREALAGQTRLLGPEDKDTLRTASDLSWTLYELGKYPESEKLLARTLESERRVLGPSDKQTLVSMSTLAWTIAEEGRYPEAEKMESEAVDIARRTLSRDDPELQIAMNNLAGIYQWEGRYADSEKLDREVIELSKRSRGLEHPDTLLGMNNLANVLAYENKFDEAIKLQEETLQIQRRVLGPEHRDTLITMSGLGNTLAGAGRFDEAEKLLRQTLDIQTRLYGPDNPRTADTIYNMACVAAKRGHPDEAFSLLKHGLEHGLAPAVAVGIESDPDLKALHSDPRFTALVVDAKQYATAQKPR